MISKIFLEINNLCARANHTAFSAVVHESPGDEGDDDEDDDQPPNPCKVAAEEARVVGAVAATR